MRGKEKKNIARKLRMRWSDPEVFGIFWLKKMQFSPQQRAIFQFIAEQLHPHPRL